MGVDLTHHALVESLSEHLSVAARIVWQGVGLGSRWLQSGAIPVPDVMTMQKSYTRPNLTIYEVKASVSDFRSDTQVGKYRQYLPFCNRFFFACPKGLLSRSDIPDGTGLITFNSEKATWAVVRSPRPGECNLEVFEWQSLLFAHVADMKRARDLSHRNLTVENAELRHIARGMGQKLARWNATAHINEGAAEIVNAFRQAFGSEPTWMAMEKLLRTLRAVGFPDDDRKLLLAAAKAIESVASARRREIPLELIPFLSKDASAGHEEPGGEH